jgi:hypothetical protein
MVRGAGDADAGVADIVELAEADGESGAAHVVEGDDAGGAGRRSTEQRGFGSGPHCRTCRRR